MVRFASGTCLDDEACCGAQAFADQMLMHGGCRQQRWNGDKISIHLTISDDHDVMAGFNRINHFSTNRCQTRFNAIFAPCDRIADIELIGFKFAARIGADVTQLSDLVEIQYRLRYFEAHWWVDIVRIKQIWFWSNKRHQRHHHRFADRIDWWVSDLRKQLFEVVVQRLEFVRHDG